MDGNLAVCKLLPRGSGVGNSPDSSGVQVRVLHGLNVSILPVREIEVGLEVASFNE